MQEQLQQLQEILAAAYGISNKDYPSHTDIGDAAIVHVGEGKVVKSRPLVSLWFHYCQAMIFKNGSRYGLAHIFPHRDSDSALLLEHLVKKFGSTAGLTAIVVCTSGRNTASTNAYDVCIEAGIPVVQCYQEPEPERGAVPWRDVVVLPSGVVGVATHLGDARESCNDPNKRQWTILSF